MTKSDARNTILTMVTQDAMQTVVEDLQAKLILYTQWPSLTTV